MAALLAEGKKGRFRTALSRSGSGCGVQLPASFARCLKNTHTKFEACSYNSFRDMRDLSQHFRFSAKWSLFSDPVKNEKKKISMEVDFGPVLQIR